MTEQEWLTSEDPHQMMSWFQDTRASVVNKPLDRRLQLYSLACCWESGREELGEDTSLCVERNSTEVPSPAKRCHIMRDIFGNPFHPHPPLWKEEVIRIDHKTYVDTYPHMKYVVNRWHSDRILEQKVRKAPPWITDTVISIARVTYQEQVGPKCEKCNGKGKRYAGYVKDLFHPMVNCPDCKGEGYKRGCRLVASNLMVLSDALEEEGCDDLSILDHLRGLPCPHCKDAPQLYSGPIWPGFAKRCHCKGTRRLPTGDHYAGCWVIDLILGVN